MEEGVDNMARDGNVGTGEFKIDKAGFTLGLKKKSLGGKLGIIIKSECGANY